MELTLSGQELLRFWQDPSQWQTFTGDQVWIDDLAVSVDGEPQASTWEPTEAHADAEITIHGGWIANNTLGIETERPSLIEAITRWRKNQPSNSLEA
ncbi:hypothetical protein [Ferrimonas marina]|nr:hypothetical protein [Ferrimonas marina]